jgi:hypothetical protein
MTKQMYAVEIYPVLEGVERPQPTRRINVGVFLGLAREQLRGLAAEHFPSAARLVDQDGRIVG